SDYFLLYANCVLVKGYKHSTICDLQLSRYLIIPNRLFTILKKLRKVPVNKVISMYPYDEDGIHKYLKLLEEENWGFITNAPKKFPALRQEWDNPSIITNAIIDYDTDSTYSLHYAIQKINQLNCESLQIRIYGDTLQSKIDEILCALSVCEYSFVELVFKYNIELITLIEQKVKELPVIQKIICYNSPKEEKKEIKNETCFYLDEVFILQKEMNESCCGI